MKLMSSGAIVVLACVGWAVQAVAQPLRAPTIPAGSLFVTIPAADFQASGPTLINEKLATYCDSWYCVLLTGIRVPHNSTVLGFELDLCDNDGTDIRAALYERGVNETFLSDVEGTISSSGITGCDFLLKVLSSPIVASQFAADYLLVVEFGSPACIFPGPPSCPDNDLRLQAARIYYAPGDGTVVPQDTTPVALP